MYKLIKLTLAVIILSTLSIKGFSQEGQWIEVRDFETWSSVGMKLKINKNWEFELEEQLRLKTNSSIVDSYFTGFNAKYKTKLGFEYGIGLRYLKKNDNQGKIQGYENHFRYNFDFGYKHSINRFKLGYRLRFQSKNELGISTEEGDYLNNHFRFKIGSKYNIKNWKFDPKFSAEIFYHMEEEEENGFNKFRATLGTSYDLKKYGDISLFYRLERELNAAYSAYPKTTYILGLNYTYTLKLKTNGSNKK